MTGVGSLFTSTSPNFTNLISDTCYDFYIRSDCAIGFSNWSGPYQFCTTPDYCNGDLFYDSGGPNGNYSNGEFNVTTIYPSAGFNTVTVDFNSFQTEGCCDYLQIFDGDDTNAPFLGQFQGSNSPGSVTSSNASGALTFLFFSDGSVTSSGWEAVVTCSFISCPNPNNLDATNITQTSADLTWDVGSMETQWEIEYDVTGFVQGSGTIIQANTNSYTLSGLNHSTTYDAYLRANCGTNPGDDDSNWIGPLTFATLDLYPPSNLVAEITDEINGTVELNWGLPASVVGDWIINLSFNCDGIDDVTAPIIFYDDFTFEVPSENSSGIWVLTGNQIVFTFDNGFQYTGTVQGNYMSGTNAAGGCWYANQVSSSDTALSMDFVVPEVLSNGLDATNPGAIYTHTFSPPISNTTVLSYNVYRDNINIASTTNTTYTDILPAFGTYEYYITAVYAVGESLPSNTEIVLWTSCPAPSNLSVSNITGSNADISWDAGSTETQWEIEYDVTGFAQGSGTIVQVGTNPFTITGLNPLTPYDLYLRANCGTNPGDDDSIWIGPISFTTLCATFTAPYTEDFETFTVSSSPFIEENCWTSVSGNYYWEVADTGDSSSGGTGPAPGVSTGNYLFTEASNSSSGDITELTTPLVDLSNLAIPSLQLDYHMYGGNMGTLEVLVNGTDNVFTVSGQQNFENDPFLSQIIDLTAYTNQTIFVVFRAIRGFGFQSDIAIDNIRFDEMPTCPDPNNLIVSSITESSADISWNNGNTETQWEIEYGLTGFAQGNGTIVQTNTNPFTLTGLNTLTSYDIYLRANCGTNPGDDDSNWIGPVSFTTLPDYCNGDLFYDSGGPNGNYSNGEFNVTTIYPSAGFNAITVDFNSFQTESCCDYMQIFDGVDTNAPLIGQYQGINSPGSVSSSNASGALTFLFSSDGSITSSGWEAVVTCSFITCPEPDNLVVTNVTESSANVSWDAGSTETQWEIEYGVTGFAQGSGTIVQVGTNSFSMTGLNPLTTYDIYLRANCGTNPGDDDSNWIGPVSFTTLCAAFTAPYTEDFETFTVSSSPFVDENCWTSVSGNYYWEVADTGDSSSSGTGPAPGVSTGNYLFTEASNSSSGDTTDLTSPLIDLSNLAIPSLQFDYHMYGGDMGTLEVLVNGTDNVFTVSGQQNFENDPFLSQIIDLTAYTNQTIFVVFRGIRGFGFQSDIAIDNIRFNEMPTCPDPSNLFTSGITGSSADISWDAGGTETQWEVEYGLAGFAQGNGTIAQTNTNPFTLTGLNTLTTYDIYLRANCGLNPGDDDSNWIGPVSFTTLPDYCNGDLFYDSGGPNGNYSNGEFNTTTIYPSAGFNTVTVDFNSFQTESCCDYLQIFDGVDTNAPLIGQYQGFNSPGSVSSSNASGALTFLFSSDGSITSSGWEAVVTCSFVTCPEPDNLVVTNVAESSADVSWDAGSTETQWEIEYGVTGFVLGSGNIVQVNTNPYTLSGLNPNTTYDAYLRANCGTNPGDDDSNWIGPVTFTTLELYPPSNLVSEITDEINGTVELNWGVAASIVGEWIINLSVSCNGFDDVSAPIIFYDDFTFEVPSENSSGTWVLTGNQIVFTFDNGFQYTGTVQGNYMSGTNAAGGCWYADQISTGNDNATTMDFVVSGISISGEITSTPNQVYTHTFNQNISNNTVSSFNVYRDNIVIASTTVTTYTDILPAYGTYTYYVTAVYNGLESVASNTEVVVWSSCSAPSNLAVTNILGNSADLSWVAGSTETEWEIEYGLAGFTQGSGTIVPTNANPYTLAGLTPVTAYDVYLRAICSTNSVDNSAWIGPVSFTTPCAVHLAPFYEHFAHTTIPDCWDEYGSENWNFSLGAAYDAASAGDHTSGQNTHYAWIDASSPNGAQHISHLKTMDIDVSQLSTPTLQFSVFSMNTDDFTYNTLRVTVSNAANETLNVLTLQGPTNNWSTYTIDLSSITLNSNIIRVEFSIEENSPGIPYFNDILIDDVIVDESSVLSVEDFDSDALSYYPNPLTDVLNVSYSKEIDKVEIYNVLGQKLKTLNTRQRNLEIDMSLFNAGTYILNIYSESSQQVIKVIKM